MEKIRYVMIIRQLDKPEAVIFWDFHGVLNWIQRDSNQVFSSLLETGDALIVNIFIGNNKGRFRLRATDVVFCSNTEHFVR